MDSLDPRCTQLKEKYEACFRTWYSSRYLSAPDPSRVMDDCAGLFREYRECLAPTLREKGIERMLEERQKQESASLDTQ